MRTSFAALLIALAACGPGVYPGAPKQGAGAISRATHRVVCLGASTTQGVGATTPYPTVLARSLGSEWSVDNSGVSGNRLSDLLARWRSELAGHGYDWVVVQGGLNDIRTTTVTADDSMNSLLSLAQEVRQDGGEPVLTTLWPCKGADKWTPEAELKRQELNVRIQSACKEGLARCVDLATPLTSPDDPELLSPVYDSGDHIHPNQAGADLIAAKVREELTR